MSAKPRPASSPVSFPPNLIPNVLTYISTSDKRTLHSLLLVSRSYYLAVVPFLYQSIRISTYEHKSPLYDAKPTRPVARGPLSKRRGMVGVVVKSRKQRALEYVRVLEVDARIGGPFQIPRLAGCLPNLRTLRLDFRTIFANPSTPTHRSSMPQFLDSGSTSGFDSDHIHDYLDGLAPSVLVMQDFLLDGPDCTDLAGLPRSVQDGIRRVIYRFSSRATGYFCPTPRSMTETLQFLPSQHSLVCDYIFWSPGPSVLFASDRDVRGLGFPLALLGWLLALHTKHLASGTRYRIVNAESVLEQILLNQQRRDSTAEDALIQIEAAYWGCQLTGTFSAAEKLFSERVRSKTLTDFVDSLGDIPRSHVFTDEEMEPWLQHAK